MLMGLSGTLLAGCSPRTAVPDVSGPRTVEQEEIIAQKKWNYEFHYESDYWSHYDLASSFIPTQANYENLVAQNIPQIEQLLGA